MTGVTNEQIKTVLDTLEEKTKVLQEELNTTTMHMQNLERIRYTPRNIVKKEAEYEDVQDAVDKTKTIKVVKKPAVIERVFDVMPKSQDDPSQDLDEKLRKKLFDEAQAFSN